MTSSQRTQQIADTAKAIRENIQLAIIGKDDVIEFTLAALFSAGHILVEDVPGSTTITSEAASSSFARVQ